MMKHRSNERKVIKMFNKRKKEEPKYSLLDTKRDEVIKITQRLYKQVKEIMIKQGVIDIYPTGTDQDKAKKDLESAKQYLLCIINEYDDKNQQYNNSKKNYPEYKSVDYPSSHEQIETYYKLITKNIL